MSEWRLFKRADELVYGDRFLFDEDLGGDNSTVTVEAVENAFGTTTVWTDDDQEIMLVSRHTVEVF